jgi:hypothetical protein
MLAQDFPKRWDLYTKRRIVTSQNSGIFIYFSCKDFIVSIFVNHNYLKESFLLACYAVQFGRNSAAARRNLLLPCSESKVYGNKTFLYHTTRLDFPEETIFTTVGTSISRKLFSFLWNLSCDTGG